MQIPFFLAQWQEYHTHIMSTAVGTIGVTEGHYGSIVAMLLSGIVGPQFYSTKLHDLGPVPEVFGFDLGQLNVRQVRNWGGKVHAKSSSSVSKVFVWSRRTKCTRNPRGPSRILLWSRLLVALSPPRSRLPCSWWTSSGRLVSLR